MEWPNQRQVKTLLAIFSPKSPFAPSIDAARTRMPVPLPLRNNKCYIRNQRLVEDVVLSVMRAVDAWVRKSLFQYLDQVTECVNPSIKMSVGNKHHEFQKSTNVDHVRWTRPNKTRPHSSPPSTLDLSHTPQHSHFSGSLAIAFHPPSDPVAARIC